MAKLRDVNLVVYPFTISGETMKLSILSAAIVVAASVAASSAVAATTGFYNDKVGFLAAVPGATEDDLNDLNPPFPNGPNPTVLVERADYDIAMNTTVGLWIYQSIEGGLDIDDTVYGRVETGPGRILTFSFDTTIEAFGFDVNGLNGNTSGNTPTTLAISGGGIAGSVLVPVDETPVFTTAFFGFISDTPFDTVTIQNTAGGDSWGFDNVVYGAAGPAVIPLPAVGWLMLSALGLLGIVGRRR